MAYPVGTSGVKIPSNIPAPMINTDAARLAAVPEPGNTDIKVTPDQTAQRIQTFDQIKKTFDDMDDNKRKAELYRVVQTQLAAGWPAYEKTWQAAGSPPEWEPERLKSIAQALPPDKANELLVTAYKGITGAGDERDVVAGRKAAQESVAAGGDEGDAGALLSPKDPKFDIVGAAKTRAARQDKQDQLDTKLAYWEERDKKRNDTIIKAAGIRATGNGDFNAIVDEVQGAIDGAQADIDDRKGALANLDLDITGQQGRATKSQIALRKQLEDGLSKARADKTKLETEKFKAQGKGGRHSGKPTAPPPVTPPPVVDKSNPLGIRPPKK